MHVTGVQAGINRRECTVSMLALRAFTYELKYETADDKRSSCRKHRASASADTLTFARSGSCDKLSRSMLSNASASVRRPKVRNILHTFVLDVTIPEALYGDCITVGDVR